MTLNEFIYFEFEFYFIDNSIEVKGKIPKIVFIYWIISDNALGLS